MLTREMVLAELAINGSMRIGESAIFRHHVNAHEIYSNDIFAWKIRKWDGAGLVFCEEDILDAVDAFIECQPAMLEFPDADELRELNQRAKDAEYNQWCEEHAEELHVIADGILKANAVGRRTMEFFIPREDTEGNYQRFFKERHYNVTILHNAIATGEKLKLPLCRIDWQLKRK